jgi:hypothetical protein
VATPWVLDLESEKWRVPTQTFRGFFWIFSPNRGGRCGNGDQIGISLFCMSVTDAVVSEVLNLVRDYLSRRVWNDIKCTDFSAAPHLS